MSASSPAQALAGDVTERQIVDARLRDAFQSYSRYVAFIGTRLLGRGDEVDDLVQDVFVEAARWIHTAREPDALKGWLATITVRVATRRLRRRKLRRMVRLSDETGVNDIPASGAPPDQRALLAQVYRILDKMPAKRRVAWILRNVEGESLDVVAQRCDCSLATAKRWIASVQQGLDEELEVGR